MHRECHVATMPVKPDVHVQRLRGFVVVEPGPQFHAEVASSPVSLVQVALVQYGKSWVMEQAAII